MGNIQSGGGFNMYNTSTITQIPTNTQTTIPAVPTSTQTTLSINTQTTIPAVPTSTQTTLPINTQTTTPPIPVITQTTTSQVPVSNVTIFPNILQTTTTPVGIMTGATQGGSSIRNPGNSTGRFNFFNSLYPNTGGFGNLGNLGSQLQNQGFRFNNIQNPPSGFEGGFGGGNPRRNPEGPPGRGSGGPPGGFGEENPGNMNNPGGLDPNVAALVNALTGMNIRGEYASKEGSFVKPGEFGGTEIEDPNEWLERFNRIAEANMWIEYR